MEEHNNLISLGGRSLSLKGGECKIPHEYNKVRSKSTLEISLSGGEVYLLALPVKERLQNDGEFIWSHIFRNVNTSEFWVQTLETLWNISYFNCGWFELGRMRRAIMPIMALVCLRLGTSWNASQSICLLFLLTYKHIMNLDCFCCLLGFLF